MTPKKSCENLHCVSPTDRMFTYMSRMSTSSLAFAFSCDRDCGEGAAHTAQRRPSAFSLAFAASSAARFTGSWCKMHIAQCPAVSHATEKYTHTHTYYIYIYACHACIHAGCSTMPTQLGASFGRQSVGSNQSAASSEPFPAPGEPESHIQKLSAEAAL